MSCIYKLITLSINVIMQQSLLGTLEDFLWRHDVDIALLEEVTSLRLNAIQLYKSYLNTGTDQPWKEIMTKNGITITNVKCLPSGRGIAALFRGPWIINVYAPLERRKGMPGIPYILMTSIPCYHKHALH
jgi:hypothetical protein